MPLAVPLAVSPPGAAISTVAPKFEYGARAPARVVAATVMTPLQLAGVKPLELAFELPAATTTTVPRERAPSMAVCMAMPHAPEPPRLRLITSAGVGLAGTPLTLPPDAHTTASAMSAVEPPQRPSTRTGWRSAFGATPTTPLALPVLAAIVPARWVPCHDEFRAALSNPHWPKVFQSPGSLASSVAPTAVVGGGGRRDEVVPGEDLAGEVRVRRDAGVDDGHDRTGAVVGGVVDGGGEADAARGLEEVPLLGVARVVRREHGLQGEVGFDGGDARVEEQLVHGRVGFGARKRFGQGDDGSPSGRVAFDVGFDILGRRVGDCRLGLGLDDRVGGPATHEVDDEPVDGGGRWCLDDALRRRACILRRTGRGGGNGVQDGDRGCRDQHCEHGATDGVAAGGFGHCASSAGECARARFSSAEIITRNARHHKRDFGHPLCHFLIALVPHIWSRTRTRPRRAMGRAPFSPPRAPRAAGAGR